MKKRKEEKNGLDFGVVLENKEVTFLEVLVLMCSLVPSFGTLDI